MHKLDLKRQIQESVYGGEPDHLSFGPAYYRS